jgi:hypothetical protein
MTKKKILPQATPPSTEKTPVPEVTARQKRPTAAVKKSVAKVKEPTPVNPSARQSVSKSPAVAAKSGAPKSAAAPAVVPASVRANAPAAVPAAAPAAVPATAPASAPAAVPASEPGSAPKPAKSVRAKSPKPAVKRLGKIKALVEDKAHTETEPQADVKAEPQADVKAEPKADVKAAPKADVKPEAKTVGKSATPAAAKTSSRAPKRSSARPPTRTPTRKPARVKKPAQPTSPDATLGNAPLLTTDPVLAAQAIGPTALLEKAPESQVVDQAATATVTPPVLNDAELWEQGSPIRIRIAQLKTRNSLLEEQIQRLRPPTQVRGKKK